MHISYDWKNTADGTYSGPTKINYFGKKVPVSAHGTAKLGGPTACPSRIIKAAMELFERIIDPKLYTRKLNVSAIRLSNKEDVPSQLGFFVDAPAEDKEIALVKATLAVQERFGNYGGGRLAAEKLLELGCKSLGFMRTGSAQPGEADKRGDGFEALCRARGVRYDELRVNDGTPPEVFRGFLEKHMGPGGFDLDGIFCCTDLLAWQTKGMLQEMGAAVPEDVQIIGFDGIQQFGDCGFYCSTIVQPVRQMAETCVSLLLDKSDTMKPALSCLPVRYVFGGTTRE